MFTVGVLIRWTHYNASATKKRGSNAESMGRGRKQDREASLYGFSIDAKDAIRSPVISWEGPEVACVFSFAEH